MKASFLLIWERNACSCLARSTLAASAIAASALAALIFPSAILSRLLMVTFARTVAGFTLPLLSTRSFGLGFLGFPFGLTSAVFVRAAITRLKHPMCGKCKCHHLARSAR